MALRLVGGNSRSENGGIFEVLLLALMINYLFNRQVKKVGFLETVFVLMIVGV